MNVIATPHSAGGRVSQKEINVIGTMQLLAACQKAAGLQRLVVKSSAAVYGSSPRDPAMFTEDMGPKALPRAGFGKDSVEVEGYVRGFSRRRPDVEITMLRLANIIGPGIRTAHDRLLRAAGRSRCRWATTPGCSSSTRTTPLQRLVLATTGPTRSASSTSPATASSRDAGRRPWPAGPICPVPLPAAGLPRRHRQARRAGRLLRRPDAVPRLRPRAWTPPGCARCCGFEPRYTTRAAFQDFVAQAGTGLPGPGLVAVSRRRRHGLRRHRPPGCLMRHARATRRGAR